jgi:hypothetical protein
MTKIKILNRYGVVPNDVLNNPKLSLKAKGLFAYIQSKPDDWNFSKDRIKNDSTDGRDGIMSGLQELEAQGYLERKKFKNEKGQWEHEYVLYEIASEDIPSSENPPKVTPPSKKERDSKKEVVRKNKTHSESEKQQTKAVKQKTTTKEVVTQNTAVAPKLPYGEFGKVKLTDAQHSKLVERMGTKNTNILITELDEYIDSRGLEKKYKNHYSTILAWARSRVAKGKQKQDKYAVANFAGKL